MPRRLTYAETVTEDLNTEFERELSSLRQQTLAPMRNLIGGAFREAREVVTLTDPSNAPHRSTSYAPASRADVTDAVRTAREAQVPWRQTEPRERAAQVRATTSAIAAAHVHLAALISLETGKPRHETIAEVQESIELLETYAAQLEETDGFRTPAISLTASDDSSYHLRPYGVFAIIVPFNFPCALAINMAAAAVLMGNTIVAKPPEDAPMSAGRILGMLAEAVPSGVVNIIHGDADVGRLLTGADIDGVAFTGSVDVGREISLKLHTGLLPKPTVAELGGSNPTIVMTSADIAAAAEAIFRSAFGIAGQKCTACSRVIVVEAAYDELLDQLTRRLRTIRVGDPADLDTFMGPMINAAAVTRYEEGRRLAAQDGSIVSGPAPSPNPGRFVEPLIVTDLPPDHVLTREEFFAPILTVTRTESLEAAVAEANAVRHGLAAGLFSSHDSEVAYFLDTIEAGVVYVNHKTGSTTGAWPGSQSMCGWKASGTTGKGGLGHYYLPQFGREQSRTISH